MDTICKQDWHGVSGTNIGVTEHLKIRNHTDTCIKVDMHKGTCPCNLSLDEVTRRDWPRVLVSRTVHMIDMNHFEEQVAETCPKNSN